MEIMISFIYLLKRLSIQCIEVGFHMTVMVPYYHNFFPEMFESGIRYLRCWTFLCVQKCYNLCMEELDYKAQQHSILSASSQNHFTSVS